MKTIVLILAITFAGSSVLADLDPALVREISAWKPGDEPPKRLLKFPDGNINDFPVCGLRVYGTAVEDYFAGVTDPRLLVAVMFDSRTQVDSIRAAARQLLRIEGPSYVATELRRHRASMQRGAPNHVWVGGEIATLEQLLVSPYLTMRVAKISTEDLPITKSESVLSEFRRALISGEPWSTVYGRVSREHPDPSDHSSYPGTVVGYSFDGTASLIGFDITTGTFIPTLRADHLRRLFQLGVGVHILIAPDGAYLYQVTEKFAGAA